MSSSQLAPVTSTREAPAHARRVSDKSARAWAARVSSQKRPSHEEAIRQRAHRIYLERGGTDNDPLGDWLQAEREYWYSLGHPERAVWRGPHSPVP